MHGFISTIGASICVAAALTSCSAVDSMRNNGGDTTCAEFNNLGSDDQSAAITKMLKDDKGKEPANWEVSATRVSAELFCKTLGKDSSKIRDIDTG